MTIATAIKVKIEVINLLATVTIKLSKVFTSVTKFAPIEPEPKLSYSFIFTSSR